MKLGRKVFNQVKAARTHVKVALRDEPDVNTRSGQIGTSHVKVLRVGVIARFRHVLINQANLAKTLETGEFDISHDVSLLMSATYDLD
jgi:hypothetical protein